MQALLITLASFVLAAEDKAPADEDVVAGWTGLAVFLLLALAVAVIGWALTRQLRRADAARRRGVFGDPPEVDDDAPGDPDSTRD